MAFMRYNAVAVGLHWLIAAIIIGLLICGFVMGEIDGGDPLKYTLYQLHKSFGICVLVLSLLRLVWRLTHRPPPLPTEIKRWEKAVAQLVHAGFYVLMIGMPLVGWLGVSTSPLGIPTVIFGLVTLPHLPFLQDIPGVSDQLFDLHAAMAWGLIGLLVLHVGAALKHHFILRDDVLLLMTPVFTHRLVRGLRRQR